MEKIHTEQAKAFMDRIRALAAKNEAEGKIYKPTCEACDDTGWIRKDQGVVRCPTCYSRQRGEAPGIPTQEAGVSLKDFTQTKENETAIKAAKAFIDGALRGLYFWGDIGTGKTRLACTILNELWKAGQNVEFFRSAHLLNQLLPGHDDVDVLMNRIANVPVICMDDIGSSQATDFARRMLLVIFEARQDKGNRTIWTGNLSLDDLGEFFQDNRLVSRIVQEATVVEMGGKDWRLKKRKR